MYKNGLAGSYSDQMSGGKSTAVYNKMAETKGKEYADSVQKSVQNRAYATIAVGAAAYAVNLGLMYYQNRY